MPLIGRGASNALRGIPMTRGRTTDGRIILTDEAKKAAQLEADRVAAEKSQNARIIMAHNARPFVPPMTLQDYEDEETAKSFSQKREEHILRNKHLQGLAARTRPVFPSNSALSSESFELLSDPRSEKDMAEAKEKEGYRRYLNTYFSEIKPGYPGALFSRTATNIPDKKGGGGRKKKSRQKKQHRRRNRRHSTRKYKK